MKKILLFVGLIVGISTFAQERHDTTAINDSSYSQKIKKAYEKGVIKGKETWQQVKLKLQKFWAETKVITEKEWIKIKKTWQYYRKLD